MSVFLCSNYFYNDICKNIYKQLCLSKKISCNLKNDIKTFHYFYEIKKMYYEKYGFNYKCLEYIAYDLRVLYLCLICKYHRSEWKKYEKKWIEKGYCNTIDGLNCKTKESYVNYLNLIWNKMFDVNMREDVKNIIKESQKEGYILNMNLTGPNWDNDELKWTR